MQMMQYLIYYIHMLCKCAHKESEHYVKAGLEFQFSSFSDVLEEVLRNLPVFKIVGHSINQEILSTAINKTLPAFFFIRKCYIIRLLIVYVHTLLYKTYGIETEMDSINHKLL